MSDVMLLNANALSIPLADGSVQMVATSPPYYGLRDYGIVDQLGLEPTPEEYVSNLVAVFREIRRVLRDDGVVFLNLGDSYAGSTMQGGNNGINASGGENGYKQSRQFEKAQQFTGLKSKDLIGIPWRVAFALQADGWWLRSDIIWSKPNPMPESVRDRPTKAHEYIFLLTKSSRYYWDQDAVREENKESTIERSRYGWNGVSIIDSDGKERRAQPDPTDKMGERWANPSGRNLRTVWNIATAPYKGAHFATWPPKLVEPMIKAGSREGDIVLDPFAGSGTTLMVARQLGRHAIGLDLSFDYLHDQARRRLELDKLAAWSVA